MEDNMKDKFGYKNTEDTQSKVNGSANKGSSNDEQNRANSNNAQNKADVNGTQNKINVKTKKKKNRMAIVIIFTIICAIVGYIAYRSSYIEIKEIGENYLGVFHDSLKYKFMVISASFIWIFLLVYSTNNRIKKGLKIFFDEVNKPTPKFPNKSISFITAAIGSIISSKFLLEKTILFFNKTSYGKTDMIYGHDIGYYMFTKPFLQAILIYVIATVAIVTLYAAIYYIVLINTELAEGVSPEALKKSVMKKQLFNNAKFIIILIAILTCINAGDLSSQTFLTVGEGQNSYSLVGAGSSDVTIKLWGYRIMSVLMIIVTFVGISAYNKKKNRRLVICIGALPIYLLAMMVILIGYNKIFVDTNEYEKEKKYISYNIEATREAYNINVDEQTVNDGGTITSDDVEVYSEEINNVSTTNKSLVLSLLNGTLTSKGQYKYSSTTTGLYEVNGEKSLVYITPREIVSNEKSYTNATYEYTHGYGIVVTSGSETNSSGDLVNIQKDYSAETNEINYTNPRIYFGLETNSTIVTNSKNKEEYDYTDSEGNTYTNTYDGTAGVSLNTLDRMILAISKGDFNLAFTSNVTKDSKILTNRNVIERAKKIMPYLTYDESPYLVVTESGNLVWVIDAYTTSNYYPYAQKSTVNGKEINYIRNSVKVIIDAYNGDTKFYITDRSDIVAMAYRNAFPDVFVDIDEKIPEEISEHFTYSEFLYDVQTEILKRYHNTETDVIYRANDLWSTATYGNGIDSNSSETTEVTPYYAVIKSEATNESKIGLIMPYTASGKQSITAYSVASYENGEMKIELYNYPSDSSVLGPMQLDTQISQNEAISTEIESLNVAGTKLTKNIVVVPVSNKLVYVESIYQEYLNESDSLPQLKKVVMASGNKIAIGDTLTEAVNNLLSEGVKIEVENPETEEEIIDSIIKANKDLKESTTGNDYEVMGKDIKQLQSLIDKLESLKAKEKSESTEDTTDSQSTNSTANM